MVGYFMRNRFPKIHKDFLKEETFQTLLSYLKSPKFQEDFKGIYWEGGTNSTSNIISLHGDLENRFYANFELKIKDDEDLNRDNLDLEKLKEHYKNLIDIIFETK